MQTTKPLLATALLLSLAACGGGGGGGGAFPIAAAPAPAAAPVAQAPAPTPVLADELPPPPPAPDDGVSPPAPAPAPAPVEPPAPPVPKTWKDADCSRTGLTLTACSVDFSDNNSTVTVVSEGGVVDAVQLESIAKAKATSRSLNNGVFGNKAVYGISFLHKLALADYPGIAFEAKLNTSAGGDTTIEDDLYVTTTVSPNCDGLSYINLITLIRDMEPQPTADGYFRYSVKPGEAKWYRTGANTYPVSGGPVLLNGVLNQLQPHGPAMALDAFLGAFPKACIWNFQNPTTQVPGGITPALDFNLGDSETVTNKKAWVKSIVIGDKVVF
ncbi:hypothetical protein [Variovorax sp. J22R115]|uniref:hypothetical protein n=1 Tax=Variovorax sp. J22R115 TaxID=3053509 RepID=UPI002576B672|nr:hypothetical protein [Variovorax sp. J22R115]MDM0047527.1 hypothetical protein [Variovorax sp. J22R115]